MATGMAQTMSRSKSQPETLWGTEAVRWLDSKSQAARRKIGCVSKDARGRGVGHKGRSQRA